eukprot:5790205-Amphidinium_carterae.1
MQRAVGTLSDSGRCFLLYQEEVASYYNELAAQSCCWTRTWQHKTITVGEKVFGNLIVTAIQYHDSI